MTLKKFILNIFSIFVFLMIFFVRPVNANNIFKLDSINFNTNPVLADLKYEVKEKTSLENPVVDPNFNVMRNTDMNKFQAGFLVGGILIIAIVTPLVTWIYFSK